ncbi:MAG: LPXTG cell wall anchor domain-containing protein, partial [Ruminococcus callidus]
SFALVAEGAPVATSTPVATATPVATGTPTASASGGYYRFDNLPTFVERNGERYLAGYQLQLCEMPKGYAATKCRIGEGSTKDSDLFADTLHLYEDADEVIILAEASSGNDFYDRNVGDNAYDIVKAKDNTDYDGGLTAIETASIESYIWNDENYNGIQDENEVGVATASVKLTRSYYDSRDTTWKLDDSFVLVATGTPVATATPVATGTPVATATPVATGTPTATASGGHYRFDNLPTYIEKDGQRYLVGYQMQLCEMPEGYAATKYHVAADSDKDSDLIAGTLDLQEPDTFLILAKAFSGNTPYCCQVRGVDYDIVKAADVTGYDGGIVQKDSHVSISGIVWDDADRDHQISDGESGIANVKIILRQYYRRNGKWELLPEAKQVAYTNADGQYRFDDLPLSVTVDGVTYLAGYRLWIDSIPAGYNAEEYADISSGSVEIRAEERTLDGCMILGIPEEKGITSGTCLEGFNIAKGEDMAFLNVFLNRDPEESTETTTATDLVTTTTETAVSTESTTQTSTSASAGTTSVESSTTETSTATTQTTASTTESSTATTRTTASTTKTSTTTTRTTASTTKTSTTTARTTASTTKTSTTTTRTTAKTQSSVVTTHTTATTRTHTTATKQTTSSVTTSKQTTHSTSHTTTAKVTASPATHTIAKTTTHTTHTTSHRTTAGTTSITTQRTSVTTSRTTATTHTTVTVTTTGSTSVTTSAIHRTTSSTTQQTTATVTLSSAGPTSVTTTTHTTSQTTTQTTPKQTTVSQTNTTSVAPTSRTTSATVSTTGTTSTGTTDSSASTGTQTTHHSTHTTTQTTTVTETTVNSTCETSGASTSIRQTTLRKNHVSGDTVTTTTTAANREHAAGHHTQTTTTAADVSAQTSGTKRIPLPRQQNISGTPKTGDTTLHITILIAACGFSLLLAILTKRRKK